jgi:demethylmenaquinone methyltransferase/2-methoxy-6-polyprenyl-1,4-benzoquinol methylase
MSAQPIPITKTASWQMFNNISAKYDYVNRLLSWGLDVRWRRLLAQHLPAHTQSVLDLATGTADLLLTIVKAHPQIQMARGIDLAEKMLEVGQKKIQAEQLSKIISLQIGDAQSIPVPDNSYDAVTSAFGIRNIPDTTRVLNEMLRMLKPRGKALILEFSLPPNPVIRFFHLNYLRFLVPLIGGIVSGNFPAYRYLNQTIETFPHGEAFCELMRHSGFETTERIPLFFGVATIYIGGKAS